tara:strand:- start:2 stop:664 length:663 start_codon:yes stop_codon:yes gene_type:complete
MRKKTNHIKLKNIWDIENSFYLKSDVTRLKKAISHYEVFKKTINVKGSVVECGVFKGISLIRFLTYRDILFHKIKKYVYGFDIFGKFPSQLSVKDNLFAKSHDQKAGYGKPVKDLNRALKAKKFINYKLIKGEVSKTIPLFLKKNKNFKISFLHIDLDVYEPTSFVLNAFYKHVSNDGIILLDDYLSIDGATRAINTFVKKNKLKLKTLKNNKKIRYIVK